MKVISCMIAILLCLFTIMPTVQAVVEVEENNTSKENIIDEKEIVKNKTKEEKDKNYNDNQNFKIMVSGILNGVEKDLNIDDIQNVNLDLLKEKGIWIEENSREYVIDLFNALTNKRYKTDDKGFLVEDIENPKKIEEQNNELNFYTEKIEELMNSQKLIIININDKYKQLNEIDKDIINIKLEKDNYALLFREDENIENSNDIILLNSEIYNKDNNTNTIAFLLNKLLELYYNKDEVFNEFKENNNFIDNSGTFSEIFDEKLEIEDNKQKEESENEINENLIDENTLDENIENNNVIDEPETVDNMPDSNVTNNQAIEKNNIFDDSISEEEFNLLLAGILSNEVNNNNLNDILKAKPEKNGIWIEENSREKFLAFLNKHTIYTYFFDEEGYLLCDNIMKDNPELDMYEKMETEVDIEIKNILKKNVLIIIDLDNKYYTYDENYNIMGTQLQSEDFLKSFSFNNQRVIILNNEYYSKAEFNLALSDYLVKALDNVQEKVITGELVFNKQPLTRSDTSKPGNMLSAQTVYAGPSSSNYATVGSVSSGEMIYLLGQQAGWYHIQYMVTGTSQQKSGFVPVSSVNNNGYSVHEEQMTGGQNFASATVNIMSCDDTDIDVSLGTVYEGEGMTVLYTYGYSDANKSYNIAYIEISTPSGTKRGYIPSSYLTGINYPSSVARVIDTNSAYSGPDNSYVKLGGAYYNEFVTILAKNTGNNWVWVEYNTPSGRKRGFMDYTKMVNYNHPGMYNDLPVFNGLKQATQQLTVYGGPSTNAANIGLIYNQETVSLLNTERGFAYIEYTTTNGAKRGYVIESYLINGNPPSIPDINPYTFSEGTYGTSGLGRSLKYYKIGNGSNVAFAVFEQHGWEDAWAYDGVELIKIAQNVIQDLSSTGISNNWTLYIIPYANPDGVTNGYTNNGPGRCTVTTKIDMNRCWPANFKAYYTSRNYTGSSALGAPEAQALENFIANNLGNGKKIILDIHGWLNQTYGDSEVASYFASQFGFKHSSTYGSGYLETWGKSMGAQSCLVELPMPSSQASIINNNYSGKVSNAIRNMLNGISGSVPEGGTQVSEQVRVTANGSLNVRSGPGTTYTVVASLSNGTIVTRIKRSVATSNGYVWDKIRLNNGVEGYVATNYLQLISADINNLTEEQVKVVKAYCRFNGINGYTGDINGSYDNDIYITVKELQRINEINQTGYIEVNDSTWNAMELNNTGIYELYRKIAENYINYNNPYGPTNFAIENTSAVFALGIKRAKLPAQDYYDSQDAKYNTMSATDRVINATSLASSETLLSELATLCSIPFPHASEGIVHFLSKEGGTHIVNDAEEIFSISEGQKGIREQYLGYTKTAIKNLLTIDKAADFSMLNAVTVDLPKTNLDWFGLYGGYQLSVEGSCYKSGNGYVAVGKCYLRDYYDFDKIEDLSDIIDAFSKGGDFDKEDLATSAFADLHYAGKAKFYYLEGYDKGFELYF